MTGNHSTLARVTAVAGALLFVPVSLVGAVAAGLAQLPADATASTLARSDIPAELLPLYQQAVQSCPGLGWPILAGIGKVESDHNRPPGQVRDAGAQGPMQFLPATWAAYGVDGNSDGLTDPFDPADAIPAAAEYLCRHDAARDTAGAVAAYLCGGVTNCLATATGPGGYATRVLDWAARYSDSTAGGSAAATLAVQPADRAGSTVRHRGARRAHADLRPWPVRRHLHQQARRPRQPPELAPVVPCLPPGSSTAADRHLPSTAPHVRLTAHRGG